MTIRIMTLLLAFAPALSCVTSREDDVSVTEAPEDDSGYAEAVEMATQTRTVTQDFETRYQVSVTYLSPAFRAAFAQRLARVYKQDRALFDEASAKAGFFVSIDAPTGGRIDLANPNHWTLLLNAGGDQALKPVVVKRLDDKERWRAFFDTVNDWTTEYLVVFDTPSIDAKSPALVEKSGLTLTFANADAQVHLSW